MQETEKMLPFIELDDNIELTDQLIQILIKGGFTRKTGLTLVGNYLDKYQEIWQTQNETMIIKLETVVRELAQVCAFVKHMPLDEDCSLEIKEIIDAIHEHLASNLFSSVRIVWTLLVPSVIKASEVIHSVFLCNPLHLCSPITPTDLVQLFLETGVDPNARDVFDMPPLYRFLSKAFVFQYRPVQKESLKILYKQDNIHNDNIRRYAQTCKYPLFVDSQYGFTQVINHEFCGMSYCKKNEHQYIADTSYFADLILSKGADPNAVVHYEMYGEIELRNSLYIAIMSCDVNTVSCLLKHKADRYAVCRLSFYTNKEDVLLCLDSTVFMIVCIRQRNDLVPEFENDDYSKVTSKGIAVFTNTQTMEKLVKKDVFLYDNIHLFFEHWDIFYFSKLIKQKTLWSMDLFFATIKELRIHQCNVFLQANPRLASTNVVVGMITKNAVTELLNIRPKYIKRHYEKFVAMVCTLIKYNAYFGHNTLLDETIIQPLDRIIKRMDPQDQGVCSLLLQTHLKRSTNTEESTFVAQLRKQNKQPDRPIPLKEQSFGHVQKRIKTATEPIVVPGQFFNH